MSIIRMQKKKINKKSFRFYIGIRKRIFRFCDTKKRKKKRKEKGMT